MRKFVGHYAPYLIAVVLLAVLILPPLVMNFHFLSSLSTFAIGLTMIVVLLYSWVELRKHDRSLCGVCGNRIRDMPSTPAKAAERRKYALMTAHLPVWGFITYMGVVLAADLLLLYSFSTYPVWICAHVPMLFLLYSHMTHRRLQPWCPICGSGSADIKERLPDRVIA